MCVWPCAKVFRWESEGNLTEVSAISFLLQPFNLRFLWFLFLFFLFLGDFFSCFFCFISDVGSFLFEASIWQYLCFGIARSFVLDCIRACVHARKSPAPLSSMGTLLLPTWAPDLRRPALTGPLQSSASPVAECIKCCSVTPDFSCSFCKFNFPKILDWCDLVIWFPFNFGTFLSCCIVVLKNKQSPEVVAHSFNPRGRGRRIFWVWDQPGVQSEFKDSRPGLHRETLPQN